MAPKLDIVKSDVDGPARILPGHSQDRELTTIAGGPKGFRNNGEHPLTLAFARKQIDTDEFAAGEVYRGFFEKMGRTGKDSLELVTGGGSGLPFTQSQVDAIHIIQAIEANLGAPWTVIIRKFCGEGFNMSEAVKAGGFVNAREVREKIRLSLNKLATAISKTKIWSHVKHER